MSEQEWHLIINGVQKGPFCRNQVLDMYKSGIISEKTPVLYRNKIGTLSSMKLIEIESSFERIVKTIISAIFLLIFIILDRQLFILGYEAEMSSCTGCLISYTFIPFIVTVILSYILMKLLSSKH